MVRRGLRIMVILVIRKVMKPPAAHRRQNIPRLLQLGTLLFIGVLPFAAPGQLQVGLQVGSAPVITVTGAMGTPCEVQWSDSIADSTRWFFLSNAVLGSSTEVTDTTAVQTNDARFYRAVVLPNPGMVLIPGGVFAMGDAFSEGFVHEKPVHEVCVSAFYMDRHEVTRNVWDDVYVWAVNNGYSFDHFGSGKAATHPIQTINWYDAVKWCNARSEMEGRTPVYYTSAAQTTVYRTGQVNLTNPCVHWLADGYRLPTEAEWEKAARGAAMGWRFPWGDTITFSDANYISFPIYTYDHGEPDGFHPQYATNDFPYTSPGGSFPANAYGLHEMTGNVWEWCWDAFDPNWYGQAGATESDTRGPDGVFTNRVLRGGSWGDDASYARCANRTYTALQAPTTANDVVGFRCVMRVPPPVPPITLINPARLANGAFRFTIINLTPGKTNVVELSTNLVSWIPVWTNVPSGITLEFTNAPAPGVPLQLFRSRQTQ